MRIVRFAMRNAMLINVATLLVVVLAVVKVFDLRREAFPAAEFDIVLVVTRYPGASPAEVERYVTDPLEDEIADVDGVDEYHSTSVEGLSVLTVKLDADLGDEDKDEARNDIQRAVDRVKDLPSTLPDPPQVNYFDSEDFPVIEIDLSGDLDYAALHAHAEALRDRLEDLPDVSGVEWRGERKKEYWIEVEPRLLERYGLGMTQLIGAVAARNVNLPGGPIATDRGEILVRTVGELSSPADIGAVVLRSNDAGHSVRVRDVARVVETFEDERRVYRANGEPAISLLVMVDKEHGDVLRMVDAVRATADLYRERSGGGRLHVEYVNDFSFFVKRRLSVLVGNGTYGLILVLVVLLLFLPKGISLVTVAGIPVSYAATIVVMAYAGMTINLISMFGLIIVLGLLGDDSIVIAENIWQHYERGASPADAASLGTREVLAPVLSTIGVTISAFLPLLLVSGVFGKIMAEMPKVVIVALLVSLFEALWILPLHAFDILHWGERWRTRGRVAADVPLVDKLPGKAPLDRLIDRVVEYYGRFLRHALHARYVVLLLFVSGFLGSLAFAKSHLGMVLFPASGIEVFFLRADMPIGTPLRDTAASFRALEAVVARLDRGELEDYVTHIGVQQNDPNDPFTQRGSHVGQIQVFLTAPQTRARDAEAIIAQVRAAAEAAAPGAGFTRVFFERMRPGPPVGKPVAIRVGGDDLDRLRDGADRVAAHLATMPGVLDVRSDYATGKDEVRIRVDEAAAAQALLTVDQIATQVMAAFEGVVATFVREAGEQVPLRVRFHEGARDRLRTLADLKLVNAMGLLVPLRQVAHLERLPGINQIVHRDGRRVVSVTADIDEHVTTSSAVNVTLMPFLRETEERIPGVTLEAGGEFEDTEESLTSLREAFAIAVALIFVILAAQFRSLTQPFVVMATIPLGITGVVWTFYAHGMPMSFLALLGIIGLTGVVINEANVLVTFLNNARLQGEAALDAAVTACKRRFRAVWMTTLGTVVGLVPMAYGLGGLDEFLQPAALALGYGQMFSSLLTLFFVPALYLIRVDIGNLLRRAVGLGRIRMEQGAQAPTN